MFKTKPFIVISLFLLNITSSAVAVSTTNLFPLQMLNKSSNDVFISFKKDIGNVFFDVPLEDNTLLLAGQYSYTYGVNFAPRDPKSQFHIIFKNDKECVFTVSYFKQPEEPRVSWAGANCTGAGYRTEPHSGYSTLVLYVGVSG